jgi:hypothetical protein
LIIKNPTIDSGRASLSSGESQSQPFTSTNIRHPMFNISPSINGIKKKSSALSSLCNGWTLYVLILDQSVDNGKWDQ